MKTTIISIVALLVTLTTNCFNVSSQNHSDYFFDKKYENNQIISATKYELDYDGLYKKTQLVEYSYNEEKELAKKEIFQWDNKKGNWIPKSKIEYTYTLSFSNNSYVIELFNWDSKKGEYQSSSEKSIYQTDINGNIVSLSSVKTDHRKNDTIQVQWNKSIAYLAM